MTFWNVFFAVLAGIISGVGINLGIDVIRACIAQRKTIKNLKFEIDFNIGKIDSFIKELGKFRDKVNSDSITEYIGYITLTIVITTTIIQMFLDRSIYKYLDDKEIGKLQNFSRSFTFNAEKLLNDQIRWGIEHYDDPKIKQKANRTIEFWTYLFEDRKKDLQAVKDKLK